MKVFVYYNLRKKMWSIRSLEAPTKNKVIGYSHTVYLKDAIPKVSEAGRQRVLRTKQKNVHAGIIGEITSLEQIIKECNRNPGFPTEIKYNPYKNDSFVDSVQSLFKFQSGFYVKMENKKVFVSGAKFTLRIS